MASAALANSIPFQLNHDWLQAIHRQICATDPNFENRSIDDRSHAYLQQLLYTDLRLCAQPTLPQDIQRRTQLDHTHILQIQEISNISESARNRYRATSKPNDVLKLHLTDGLSSVTAFTDRPIPGINSTTKPGAKILLRGPVEVRNGVLVLRPEYCTLLGGEVAALQRPCEKAVVEWNKQCVGHRGDPLTIQQKRDQATGAAYADTPERGREQQPRAQAQLQRPAAAVGGCPPPPPQQQQQQPNGNVGFGSQWQTHGGQQHQQQQQQHQQGQQQPHVNFQPPQQNQHHHHQQQPPIEARDHIPPTEEQEEEPCYDDYGMEDHGIDPQANDDGDDDDVEFVMEEYRAGSQPVVMRHGHPAAANANNINRPTKPNNQQQRQQQPAATATTAAAEEEPEVIDLVDSDTESDSGNWGSSDDDDIGGGAKAKKNNNNKNKNTISYKPPTHYATNTNNNNNTNNANQQQQYNNNNDADEWGDDGDDFQTNNHQPQQQKQHQDVQNTAAVPLAADDMAIDIEDDDIDDDVDEPVAGDGYTKVSRKRALPVISSSSEDDEVEEKEETPAIAKSFVVETQEQQDEDAAEDDAEELPDTVAVKPKDQPEEQRQQHNNREATPGKPPLPPSSGKNTNSSSGKKKSATTATKASRRSLDTSFNIAAVQAAGGSGGSTRRDSLNAAASLKALLGSPAANASKRRKSSGTSASLATAGVITTGVGRQTTANAEQLAQLFEAPPTLDQIRRGKLVDKPTTINNNNNNQPPPQQQQPPQQNQEEAQQQREYLHPSFYLAAPDSQIPGGTRGIEPYVYLSDFVHFARTQATTTGTAAVPPPQQAFPILATINGTVTGVTKGKQLEFENAATGEAEYCMCVDVEDGTKLVSVKVAETFLIDYFGVVASQLASQNCPDDVKANLPANVQRLSNMLSTHVGLMSIKQMSADGPIEVTNFGAGLSQSQLESLQQRLDC